MEKGECLVVVRKW